MQKTNDAKQESQHCVLLKTNETYRSILNSLLRKEVKFFVVGGQSMIAFGMPNRTTKDLDIQVGRTAKNLKKLRGILRQFKTVSGLLSEFGNESTFARVQTANGDFDIGYHLHGMSFERGINHSIPIQLFGTIVPGINLWNMCIVKLVVQRENYHPKHVADIEWMRSKIIS